MSNVLFFPGIDEPSTFIGLHKHVPDMLNIPYDFTKSREYVRLDDIVRDYEPSDTLLVGQGLGAVFAESLAEDHCMDCVLINPTINVKPYVQTMLLNRGMDADHGNVPSFLAMVYVNGFPRPHNIGRIVVLGKEDTVSDWTKTDDTYKYYSKIFSVEDGHVLNMTSLKMVADLIQFQRNNIHL